MRIYSVHNVGMGHILATNQITPLFLNDPHLYFSCIPKHEKYYGYLGKKPGTGMWTGGYLSQKCYYIDDPKDSTWSVGDKTGDSYVSVSCEVFMKRVDQARLRLIVSPALQVTR
jgi:hypothetical protein